MFLDDEVALSLLNDGLDLWPFVPSSDKEPQRMLTHRLEGGRVNFDREGAASLGALADERQQVWEPGGAILELRNVSVHLAEELLVAERPLLSR